MDVVVSSVDYNPPELAEQVPFTLALLRVIAGPDRPDYWLGELHEPLRWIDGNIERSVEHLVICSRWAGTQIEDGFANLPVGIAYVTDPTLLSDPQLSFGKCQYVAIGIASDVSDGSTPTDLANTLSGSIADAFGTGNPG